MFYATRFASPQGSLLPLTPQESLVLYRPKPIGFPGEMEKFWALALSPW